VSDVADSDHTPQATPPTARVAVLDNAGAPPTAGLWRPSRHFLAWITPTATLLVLLLGLPTARTVILSWTDNGRFVGLENYIRVLSDPQVRVALRNTLLWAVVVPLIVTCLGYALAVTTRARWGGRVITTVLVAPIALPMVAVGIAFRLLYHPDPAYGLAAWLAAPLSHLTGAGPDTALPMLWPWLGRWLGPWLGPRLITVAAITAFVWAWAGLAMLVFRYALHTIPPEIEDVARAEGATALGVLRTVHFPLLRRVAIVLFALAAAAASRTFELILVLAPGSVQDEAELLSLHVWRSYHQGPPGHAAALGVLWLMAVLAGVLLFRRAIHDPTRQPVLLPDTDQPQNWWRQRRTRVRVRRVILSVALLVFWCIPVALLVLTSLHNPVEQALHGWRAPLSLDSYREVLPVLTGPLLRTFLLAGAVMLIVVALSAPAAYALTWLGRPSRPWDLAVLLCALVLPIQVIADPLSEVLGVLRLSGTTGAVILTHVVLGIPVTTLILRSAFEARPPAHQVDLVRLRDSNWRALLTVVVPHARPAVIAAAALQFVQVWNDVVVSLLFDASQVTPIGITILGEARQFSTGAGTAAAGAVLASLPPLVVVITCWRSIVETIGAGVRRI